MPAWLSLEERHWPQNPSLAEMNDELTIAAVKVDLNINVEKSEVNYDSNVLENLISKSNSLDLLLRRTRILRRFGEMALNKVAHKRGQDVPYPTMEEGKRAMISLVKYVQNKHFSRELHYFYGNF